MLPVVRGRGRGRVAAGGRARRERRAMTNTAAKKVDKMQANSKQTEGKRLRFVTLLFLPVELMQVSANKYCTLSRL